MIGSDKSNDEGRAKSGGIAGLFAFVNSLLHIGGMGGGRIGVTVLAWMILAAGAPPRQADAGQAKPGVAPSTKPGVAPSTELRPAPPQPVPAAEAAKSPDYERPCLRGEDARGSDLCAQWKAADAATAAAYWAKWSLFLGIAGTIGLFLTIYYTRRAVKLAVDAGGDAKEALEIAERNANAAAEQVRVSEETAARQLRPWLDYDEGRIEGTDGDGKEFALKLTNFGKSPATGVEIYVNRGILPYPFEAMLPPGDLAPCRDVPPGHFTRLRSPVPKRLKSGHAVLIRLTIRYDAGGWEKEERDHYLVCDEVELKKDRIRLWHPGDMLSEKANGGAASA